MRGGVLPPALLFAALAFALAYAPRGSRLPAIVAALIAAFAVAQAPLAPHWVEYVFFGCWSSVIVTASSIHLRRPIGSRGALVLGANAGIWAGATIALLGTTLDLAKATPVLVLVVPAVWLVSTRRGIALKVAGSWLIAIAALAMVLPIIPTPGYAPDHME
ncbi:MULTISPECIES: hypothetical protein [Sphingosinicellaceae]|uniref:hypothetical protein n=1 Tax=Sphingosinicellaceae TaxID=2820280 RepID=UPI001C1E04E1|nr:MULTISPECIES: hypothetical protein [Polymorphobacter]QYE34983.1 hypothetical protein KZX46_20030 [Polymorphobacter sp. PAMC 29334]UAJ11666.1 hypothetical protein KTC28_08395 [Polymorphobacter megasporae]